jgi:unsaturated rhamnogalacturonyl hydrolase
VASPRALIAGPFLAFFSVSSLGRAADAVVVRVQNPLGAARASETIAVRLGDVKKLAPGLEPGRTVVGDEKGKVVLSQLVDTNGDDEPDELVFQSDLRASESKSFILQAGRRRTPAAADFKVYGRFVRERHDDFVWENDRTAHRMYGPDLEGWRKEPLTSSGVDVWLKRTKRLIANEWYQTDDYHTDRGDGADVYSVGKSRGCGGLGVWSGEKLHTSRNFVRSRVLANGPVRLVFELDYAPWDAGGVKVFETKRIVLDAGQTFERHESTFFLDGPARPLGIGLGIAKHVGGRAQFDRKTGVLTTWEPLTRANGSLGCAVVAAPKAIADYRETDTDFLVVTRGPTAYYAGFAWDAVGDARDERDWHEKAQALAREAAAPLRVTLAAGSPRASAELTPSWAVRACESLMAGEPNVLTSQWKYDVGLELRACQQAAEVTSDKRIGGWVKRTVDGMIDPEGNVGGGYELAEYNSDSVAMGKVVFDLYEDTKDPKDKARYRKALTTLRDQMRTHPRTKAGAFWHKQVYPYQQWLDGVFMTGPFLARYGHAFNEPALFDDVVHQVALAEKGTRDPKTGLLVHGYDESKKERWADSRTGRSAHFWGRAMGWYAMALVDVLELLPEGHPKRGEVLGVLGRLATAIAAVQDPSTGVWWQVLDAGPRAKNFRESSASAMFVYALSKAVRKGFIERAAFGPVAEKGYRGLLKEFVEVDARGRVTLKGVCKVAGLGGNPYRDGSYDYYVSTEVVSNDPKGLGALILASLERDELAR